MPSSHLILCRPLLLLSPIPPSIRVFSNESALCMRWPKCWSFSFSISSSNEHPGLISFRMDWLDLLEVQGTLKSLLQHHCSKASILWHSAFFTVQLSHPYMTTGKTIALTRRTFVGKVMSLLFNMLSRLVVTFLPRSKRLLISWLQSPSAVILEPRKIKSDTVSPSICHEVMGPDVFMGGENLTIENKIPRVQLPFLEILKVPGGSKKYCQVPKTEDETNNYHIGSSRLETRIQCLGLSSRAGQPVLRAAVSHWQG